MTFALKILHHLSLYYFHCSLRNNMVTWMLLMFFLGVVILLKYLTASKITHHLLFFWYMNCVSAVYGFSSMGGILAVLTPNCFSCRELYIIDSSLLMFIFFHCFWGIKHRWCYIFCMILFFLLKNTNSKYNIPSLTTFMICEMYLCCLGVFLRFLLYILIYHFPWFWKRLTLLISQEFVLTLSATPYFLSANMLIVSDY